MKRLTMNAKDLTSPNEAVSGLKLLRAMRNGWEGRPLIVRPDGDGHMALTGAHRLAAAAKLRIRVPVLLVEDSDLDFEAWHRLDDESDAEDIFALLTKQGLAEVAEILEQERNINTNQYVRFVRRWLSSECE